VVRSNSKAVQDYLDGTESAVKFLVGQVMKATKGAADPNVARSVLLEYLEASQKGS
jgi:aspartyl-tRNA(Asn)/glutamyl-tRNA(Gln) amidotransferase subunit B